MTFLYAPQKSAGAVDCCQDTVVDAGALLPTPLSAGTGYVWLIAGNLLAVAVFVVLAQFVHEYAMGELLQFAVRVMALPVNGAESLEVTEHAGGAVGRGCQLTDTLAAAPVPEPFTPATEYATSPAFADVAEHVA